MDGYRHELRNFITTSFLFGQSDGFTFSDEDSFLDLGIIDSTGVLELVAFLEEQYGIQIADDELVPENLDSIAGLLRFVARKHATVPA
jgi:acyl carrier protein